MNDKNSLENQINQALDDSVESLSPDVRRRLNQIRIEATEKKSGRSPMLKFAAAMSFLFVLTLSWQLWQPLEEVTNSSFAEVAFFEVLEEDPDMLDDLEFVYWMAEESNG